MANRSKSRPRVLCVELPTEHEAMNVAERIANKLAEGRGFSSGRVVTVTDEHRNVVGKVPVPRKH